MSMTHDESSTYCHLIGKNIFPHLFDPNAWGNANNHWLNTLSIQVFTNMFGPHEWAIRLFNVLAFGAYAFFTIRLLLEMENKYLQMAAFLFMAANPYLLDFFSTARGYGLSLAFTNAALYFGTKFIKSDEISQLIWCLTLLLLATLSLFSSVIFFPAMIGGIFMIYMWMKWVNKKALIRPMGIIIVFATITAALTIIPIRSLSRSEEFKWGAQSMLECFNSLVTHSSYSKAYAPNGIFLVGFLTCLLVFAFIKIGAQVLNRDFIIKRRTLVTSCITFLLLLVIMFMARHLSDTFYPIDRKTVMFLPFLGLISFGAMDLVSNRRIKTAMGTMIAVLLAFHFILSVNFHSVREWWYDENTKEFAHRVMQDTKQPPSLGCHWMFHPTLTFYNQTLYDNKLKIHEYNKEIDTMQVYDYFICFDSDVEKLKPKYNALYRIPEGRIILKRK